MRKYKIKIAITTATKTINLLETRVLHDVLKCINKDLNKRRENQYLWEGRLIVNKQLQVTVKGTRQLVPRTLTCKDLQDILNEKRKLQNNIKGEYPCQKKTMCFYVHECK